MSESELLITANNCIKSESIENSIMCKSESESNNNNNNNENGSSNSGSSGNKATRKRLSSDQEPQEIDHESKQIKTNQNGSSIAVKSEESDTGKSKTGGAVFNHDSEAQRVRAACGKAAATGSSGGGPQSGALGNKDFLYKYMYVEKYENGGGYILHAYQDELGELDQADLDLFINRIKSESCENIEPSHEKKTRKSISQIDKERLIRAYNESEDYLTLAKQLEISESAAKNIIYKYRKYGLISTGKHGGHKKPIIHTELGQRIIDYIEDRPQSTLAEIQNYVQENKEIQLSQSTISRFLTGQIITIKNVRSSVEDRNSERVKDLRFKYAYRFLKECWGMSECIYIGEISFKLWTGQSLRKKGLPDNIDEPTNRNKNLSLVMAINKKGPVLFKVYSGSIDHSQYQSFIWELSSMLPETQHYLIQDNARVGINGISNHDLINLPPYSSFLNAIEAFFVKLKKDIITEISNNRKTLTSNQQQSQVTVKQTIENMAGKEEYKDMRKYFRDVKKFFVDCLQKSDIFVD